MKIYSRYMKTARLPMFRSDEQARILTVLFVQAKSPLTLTEIADRAGVSLSLTHKEIGLLEGAGLVRSERRGRARLVEANQRSPLVSDLRSLLTKAFGPSSQIEEAISDVEGIEQAFIFGSWAESEAGTPTGGSNDIDLMVIGSPNVDALYDRVQEVEERIGLPINITLRGVEEWVGDVSGFADRVRNSETIKVR